MNQSWADIGTHSLPAQAIPIHGMQRSKANGWKTNYLSDIIGMFEYIMPPKQVTATKTLRELYIRNERDKALQVTFANEELNLIPPTLENGKAPPILVVTSTAVSNFVGALLPLNKFAIPYMTCLLLKIRIRHHHNHN